MMLVYDPATNPLNSNEWAFPVMECFHIAAFAFSVGTIGLVDLRLLGLGLTRQKPSQLLNDTMLWTLGGLIVVITSGLLIFSTDPVHYAANGAFQFKMIALVIAIVYNYTIHRKAVLADASGIGAKAIGALSLLLWISIIFGGLFYAFT